MEAIDREAKKVLKLFSKETKKVVSYVGPEQEYFLVDSELYNRRKDLMLTGRTLFGAMPAKGQELEDHYFGQIKERVSSFMKEVDEELWKLGVFSKTKHNEVAPAQHEIAPVFSVSNVAADHNQLTMEVLRKVAKRHGLVCLLHEKPYEGINGSGKHNNWSLGTVEGENLLKPGKNPKDNAQFLLFLAAIVKAVDDYAELLRLSVATAGNDHRLGANEAPPAIVSIYLGDQLEGIVNELISGKKSKEEALGILNTGVASLPILNRDTTDRNRTSPFAFTGNRFEFRMPGSSQSVSGINIVINTIVAEALSQFAEELEGEDDIKHKAIDVAMRAFKKHKKVIFNGNGYSDEWVKEAEKRGLPNLKTTPDALPYFAEKKSVDLFEKHGVFTKVETITRTEILLEDYYKALNIEVLTMLEMAKQQILPACIEYVNSLVDGIASKEAIGIKIPKEKALATKISKLTESLIANIDALDKVSAKAPSGDDALVISTYYKDKAIPAMAKLRATADELETLVAEDYWPFPTYTDLLYRI